MLTSDPLSLQISPRPSSIMKSETATCEYMMKVLLAALSLCLVLSCSPTGESVAVRVSDLIMPATVHPNLSVVEIVLEVEDMHNPPADVPKVVVQTLKELGIVSAVNATYTWGDPDGFLLIDANIYRFATAEAAKSNVLSNLEGRERIDGIGDAATLSRGQSLSFSVDAVKVALTAISDEVDVRSVAATYADWLAAN